MMHAAHIEHSDRLRRVYALLRDGRPRTTLDIVREAGVCAVNSIAAELRANGVRIACQRAGNLWWYWIADPDPAPLPARGEPA